MDKLYKISKMADGVAKLLMLIYQIEGNSVKGARLKDEAWKMMQSALPLHYRQGLELAERYPGITTREIAVRMKVTDVHAGTVLGRLRDIGLLECDHRYPYRWRLPDWLTR